MKPLVALDGVSISRGGRRVVHEVTLDVPSERLTALVGPSGCGKTTLLRAIAGFEPLDAGTIAIDGLCVAASQTHLPPERRRVGMVFQEGALFPHLTVQANVRFGLVGRDDARRRALETLERAGIAELAARYPDELSGGQQQLVALARALAPSPQLILMDEPFANLDATLRAESRDAIVEVLRRLRATTILVTHDQQEALSTADRVAVMRAGRILQFDRPEHVYRRPADAAVAEFIGGGQLLEAELRDGRAVCRLGSLEAHGDAAEGPVLVLARPEELSLESVGASGATGCVVRERFFGHDALTEVRLDDSSLVLRVREAGRARFATGDRVAVVARAGSYRVFPRD